MPHTLQAYRDDPDLLRPYRVRDLVPCVCGRCGAEHTKIKRVVQLAMVNDDQEHFYCNRSCSSLRQTDEAEWDTRDGVEGRVCKNCGDWTPKNKLHGGRGWICSACVRQTPRYRHMTYRKSAAQRNIPFDLSYKEFMVFWQEPCHYCEGTIDTIGIDRVDNAKGYEAGNVVSCCSFCNWMKGDGTTEEFIARCVRVAERHPC